MRIYGGGNSLPNRSTSLKRFERKITMLTTKSRRGCNHRCRSSNSPKASPLQDKISVMDRWAMHIIGHWNHVGLDGRSLGVNHQRWAEWLWIWLDGRWRWEVGASRMVIDFERSVNLHSFEMDLFEAWLVVVSRSAEDWSCNFSLGRQWKWICSKPWWLL